MKKYVVVFLIMICFLPIHAKAIDSLPMNYQKLFEFEKPEGYKIFQGMAVTDKYFVIAAIIDDTSNTALLVYDKDTYKLADILENPITEYKFGHANDMEYNKDKNEIYIVDQKNLFILDATTLKKKSIKALPIYLAGIAYDEETKQFYFRNETEGYIYNENFEEISHFPMLSDLARQGISFDNNHLFYSCYANISEGVINKNENYIYIYDKIGNQLSTLSIPIGYGELEAMEFDSTGIPYLLFNTPEGKGAIYIPKYNEIEKNIIVSDKTDEKTSASLYNEFKKLETVKIKDGKYVFSSISYKKPGIYTYKIVKEGKESDELQVDVNVTYDALTNTLQALSSYEKEAFEKKEENVTPVIDTVQKCEVVDGIYYDPEGKETTKENFERICKTVENPQTGSFLPFILLPVLLLCGLGVLLYKKKIFFKL